LIRVPSFIIACAARATVALIVAFPLVAAAEYRSTRDAATVMYDAPSARAKPLFVYGRDVPVEPLVSVEGWTKVRDASGTIGWMQTKSLGDKRMLIVRAPGADIHVAPDDKSPLAFRADRDVLLELAEPATSAAATANPGWVKVRHRDGVSGYVRIAQVFGL
jgi:SH3-like domain-containing protein